MESYYSIFIISTQHKIKNPRKILSEDLSIEYRKALQQKKHSSILKYVFGYVKTKIKVKEKQIMEGLTFRLPHICSDY